MATPTFQTPGYFDAQQINRQREMAKVLQQQGMQQPQGQMVSGRYIAPSFAQYLAPALATYVGSRKQEQADTAEKELAARLQAQQAAQYKQYSDLATGDAGVAPVQGPTPEGNNLSQTVTPVAPRAPDRAAATNFALQSTDPALRAMALKRLEGVKLGEGEQFQEFNLGTGKFETTAKGGDKYREPIRIDLGDRYEIRHPDGRIETVRKGEAPGSNRGQVIETEGGHMLVNTRTGAAQPILGPDGQPLGGGKALTEVQAKDTGYYGRMKEADKILQELQKGGVTTPSQIKERIGTTLGELPLVGSALKSISDPILNKIAQDKYQQQVEQAQQNFVTAVLRRESGAAISAGEFKTEREKYFPQPGDDAAVIAQKAKARQDAINAVKLSAGPGATRWDKDKRQAQVNAITNPADRQAVDWALANQSNPQAKEILRRNGID